MAEKAIQGFKTGPLFTPPSVEGTIVRPGTTGGANWSGAAVDPATGHAVRAVAQRLRGAAS